MIVETKNSLNLLYQYYYMQSDINEQHQKPVPQQSEISSQLFNKPDSISQYLKLYPKSIMKLNKYGIEIVSDRKDAANCFQCEEIYSSLAYDYKQIKVSLTYFDMILNVCIVPFGKYSNNFANKIYQINGKKYQYYPTHPQMILANIYKASLSKIARAFLQQQNTQQNIKIDQMNNCFDLVLDESKQNAFIPVPYIRLFPYQDIPFTQRQINIEESNAMMIKTLKLQLLISVLNDFKAANSITFLRVKSFLNKKRYNITSQVEQKLKQRKLYYIFFDQKLDMLKQGVQIIYISSIFNQNNLRFISQADLIQNILRPQSTQLTIQTSFVDELPLYQFDGGVKKFIAASDLVNFQFQLVFQFMFKFYVKNQIQCIKDLFQNSLCSSFVIRNKKLVRNILITLNDRLTPKRYCEFSSTILIRSKIRNQQIPLIQTIYQKKSNNKKTEIKEKKIANPIKKYIKRQISDQKNKGKDQVGQKERQKIQEKMEYKDLNSVDRDQGISAKQEKQWSIQNIKFDNGNINLPNENIQYGSNYQQKQQSQQQQQMKESQENKLQSIFYKVDQSEPGQNIVFRQDRKQSKYLLGEQFQYLIKIQKTNNLKQKKSLPIQNQNLFKQNSFNLSSTKHLQKSFFLSFNCKRYKYQTFKIIKSYINSMQNIQFIYSVIGNQIGLVLLTNPVQNVVKFIEYFNKIIQQNQLNRSQHQKSNQLQKIQTNNHSNKLIVDKFIKFNISKMQNNLTLNEINIQNIKQNETLIGPLNSPEINQTLHQKKEWGKKEKYKQYLNKISSLIQYAYLLDDQQHQKIFNLNNDWQNLLSTVLLYLKFDLYNTKQMQQIYQELQTQFEILKNKSQFYINKIVYIQVQQQRKPKLGYLILLTYCVLCENLMLYIWQEAYDKLSPVYKQQYLKKINHLIKVNVNFLQKNQKITIKNLNSSQQLLGKFLYARLIQVFNDFLFSQLSYNFCIYPLYFAYQDGSIQVMDRMVEFLDQIFKTQKQETLLHQFVTINSLQKHIQIIKCTISLNVQKIFCSINIKNLSLGLININRLLKVVYLSKNSYFWMIKANNIMINYISFNKRYYYYLESLSQLFDTPKYMLNWSEFCYYFYVEEEKDFSKQLAFQKLLSNFTQEVSNNKHIKQYSQKLNLVRNLIGISFRNPKFFQYRFQIQEITMILVEDIFSNYTVGNSYLFASYLQSLRRLSNYQELLQKWIKYSRKFVNRFQDLYSQEIAKDIKFIEKYKTTQQIKLKIKQYDQALEYKKSSRLTVVLLQQIIKEEKDRPRCTQNYFQVDVFIYEIRYVNRQLLKIFTNKELLLEFQFQIYKILTKFDLFICKSQINTLMPMWKSKQIFFKGFQFKSHEKLKQQAMVISNNFVKTGSIQYIQGFCSHIQNLIEQKNTLWIQLVEKTYIQSKTYYQLIFCAKFIPKLEQSYPLKLIGDYLKNKPECMLIGIHYLLQHVTTQNNFQVHWILIQQICTIFFCKKQNIFVDKWKNQIIQRNLHLALANITQFVSLKKQIMHYKKHQQIYRLQKSTVNLQHQLHKLFDEVYQGIKKKEKNKQKHLLEVQLYRI